MRERTRTLAAASLTLLASVAVWFNYSAVLPLVVEAWGLSGTVAGALFAAFQAGYLVTIVPVGRLADTRDTRYLVAAGAAGTGLASVGFALLARGPVGGVAWRFLAGACMAGVYVPGMRLLSEHYPDEVRGRAMGVYTGAFSLGTGVSFLASSWVATATDWRTAIALTSVGAITAGPLFLAVTRPRSAAPDEATDETNGTSDADAESAAAFDLGVVRNATYRSAVGVYAGHTWELFGVRTWLAAFLATAPALAARPDATALAGTLTGVTLAVGGAGNALGGALSDRLGRARTVAACLGASTLITAGLGVVVRLPFPALVAVLLVYGVVLTADSAPTSTAITEVVADDRMGFALSLQAVAGFGATVVSPVAFGYVLDWAGYGPAFLVLAAGGAAGVVAARALGRRRATDADRGGDVEEA